MSVTIKYKGNTIASANTDTTKTLQTSGKYCEGDIVVENVQDGGITPSGSVTLTEENTYDVTDKAQAVVDMSATRANLAEAVTAKGVDTLPTSSFDTIATNIGLISGGGGGDEVVISSAVRYPVDIAKQYIPTFPNGMQPNSFYYGYWSDFDLGNLANNRVAFLIWVTDASGAASYTLQIRFRNGAWTTSAISTNYDGYAAVGDKYIFNII